jgi:membrane dipeptidase
MAEMAVSERSGQRETTGLQSTPLVWDSHGGFAYEKADDLVELARWRKAGIDFLSINIGYDVEPWTTAIAAASAYRHWLRHHDGEYLQVETFDDVLRAKAEGKLAVAFDLEGMNALNGDPGMVDLYYRLGVRQMLFAYNRNNLAGGGCHDADLGLTGFGREVLAEMNRLGMIVDCSHCSHRTSLEVMALSASPVVFSHSNARALCDHERNIRDDQIKACAAQGGVIGVTGVGLFLGARGADPLHLLEHIDYLCALVGPAHVGIGMDSILDNQSEDSPVSNASEYWPAQQYPDAPMDFMPPEAFPVVRRGLADRGYGTADIDAIIGGNFARIASQVWKPVAAK